MNNGYELGWLVGTTDYGQTHVWLMMVLDCWWSFARRVSNCSPCCSLLRFGGTPGCDNYQGTRVQNDCLLRLILLVINYLISLVMGVVMIDQW